MSDSRFLFKILLGQSRVCVIKLGKASGRWILFSCVLFLVYEIVIMEFEVFSRLVTKERSWVSHGLNVVFCARISLDFKCVLPD